MRTSALLSLLLLSACSSILPEAKPAPRQYVLKPAPETPRNAVPLPFSLEILAPQAAPGLDSARIAELRTGQRLDYFAEARWASPLPILVQHALMERFERRLSLASVSDDLTGARADLLLAVDVRDFTIDDTASSGQTAKVRLAVRLLRLPARDAVAFQEFSASEPVSGNRMEDVVSALQAAYDKVADQLVLAMGTKIAALPPSAPAAPTIPETKRHRP